MTTDGLPPLPPGQGVEDELMIELWRVLSNVHAGTDVREGVEQVRKAAWVFAERLHGHPFTVLA